MFSSLPTRYRFQISYKSFNLSQTKPFQKSQIKFHDALWDLQQFCGLTLLHLQLLVSIQHGDSKAVTNNFKLPAHVC